MSNLWAMQIFWTFSIPAGRQRSRNHEVQACRFLQKCLFIMGQFCIHAPLKSCCIEAKDVKITCKEEKEKMWVFSNTLSMSKQHFDLGCQHRFTLVSDSINTWGDMRSSWLMIPCHEAWILLGIWLSTWATSSPEPLPAKLLPVKTPNCRSKWRKSGKCCYVYLFTLLYNNNNF